MITFIFTIIGLINGFKYSLKNKYEKNKAIKTTLGFGVIGLIIGFFVSPFISSIFYIILTILIAYTVYGFKDLIFAIFKKQETKEVK